MYKPHKGPQTYALTRPEFEILYGGARGGGKTFAGILRLLYDSSNPKFRSLVIRLRSDDLKDWIDRAMQVYEKLGAVCVGNPPEIRFPSGAIIRTGHLNDANAYTKYQGHEYHRILIEELTQIPSEESYMKLISSCRSTIPELKPQVFCTTNPGGIGHSRVKKRFIDPSDPNTPFKDITSGRSRIFVPAKVEDNPTLLENDPDYVKFLDSLPDDLKEAWRHGSREVYETKGSYYFKDLMEARKEGRVCGGLYEKSLDVYKFRDLGIDDEMVIVCAQFFGKEIRIVDCIRGSNEGLDHYIKIVKEKGYGLDNNYFPHDIEVREQTNNGRSRREYLEGLGIRVNVTPKVLVEDGIQAVRSIFSKMYFEKAKTEKLLEALTIYRKKYDEKNNVYLNPIHDRSSNFADAMRYLAVNYEDITMNKTSMSFLPKRQTYSSITGQRKGSNEMEDYIRKRRGKI